MKWRESRGEGSLPGTTVVEKSTTPLIFQPDTGWFYGTGIDWAGKAIERVTGETLETYMSKNIWSPLGITDITFWPHQRADMKDRVADISILDPEGHKAVDARGWSVTGGVKECLGGGGAYGTPKAYFTLLQAVLREDPKLLRAESYTELFRPQLNDQCKQALNHLILTDQQQQDYLSVNVPPAAKKNWCLAGLLLEEDLPGWLKKGTILWAGLPCIVWVGHISRSVSQGLC